ncbi:MAG: isopentenyl-diphosphate Delta-isomerase [Acidobacteria bacterium]|nr:isopentenyl-diphosphate Delta-isomerase [Acidobacteriota bacterium]
MRMITPKRTKEILIAATLLLLAVSAFFMVNVPLPPWSHWLSGLNVVLFAIPAFWATRRWLGWRDASLLWAILGVYALLIETLAIFTGFPYGHFGYSGLLGAKLFGLTPWTVFLAWTPLIIGAYAVSRTLFGNIVVRVLATAAVATCFDLVLDPGAVRLGFWKYAANIGFYGVPISNFVGWLITGSLAAIVIELFLRRAKPLLRVPVQLASSAFLIVFFWTAIAAFGGMVWPAVIGLAIVIWLAIYWFKYHYRFDEMLVYVDDAGTPLATEAKPLVHHAETRLHLAFSIFLFNSKGELLLQQRALTKRTWPGVWSNSCCGHVMLHERTVDAAKRRLKFELGISGVDLKLMLPDFRYRAEKDGIVENEICPVFVGVTDKLPRPNPDEVGALKWVDWSEFRADAASPDTDISPWAVEEVELLTANEEFKAFFGEISLRH